MIVLIVGGVGLSFNFFGMFIFGHGGHGHAHGTLVVSDVAEPVDQPAQAQEQPKDSHGHGHNGKMAGANMRALFLHAFGDALGSIGVIVSASVIWLTPFSWRFYFDPIARYGARFLLAFCLFYIFPVTPASASRSSWWCRAFRWSNE